MFGENRYLLSGKLNVNRRIDKCFLKFSENRIDRFFGLLYTVIDRIAKFQDRFPELLMSANLDDYTRL